LNNVALITEEII